MIDIARVELAAIAPLRDLYRRAMNCQIVHDSLHARGFTHQYLIRAGGEIAGYGCVLGYEKDPKDIVKEFYVAPEHRRAALTLFRTFVDATGAKTIEAQTNDVLLTLLLLDCATEIQADKILFRDEMTTRLSVPGATFRRTANRDRPRLFDHRGEPQGDWLIEIDGAVAATGGLLFHYNPPYGDVYMEVAEPFRRRGIGSYLVQELKRTCYEMGKVPAARCNAANTASRGTLQKAGMLPCARILKATIARGTHSP